MAKANYSGLNDSEAVRQWEESTGGGNVSEPDDMDMSGKTAYFKPSKQTPESVIRGLNSALRNSRVSKDGSGWYSTRYLGGFQPIFDSAKEAEKHPFNISYTGDKNKNHTQKYAKLKHKLHVKGKTKPGSLLNAYKKHKLGSVAKAVGKSGVKGGMGKNLSNVLHKTCAKKHKHGKGC